MRKIRKLATGSILLCAAVLVPGVANGQIVAQGNGYLMRMKFTPGKVYRYAISQNMNMSTMKVDSTMTMTEKVLKFAKGVATIQASMGNVKILMNGKPLDKKQVPQQLQGGTIQMDTRGNAVGAMGKSLQQTQISLPEKPIRIGSSWVSSMSLPVQGQNMDLTTTAKFVGTESIAGVRAAKITTVMKTSGKFAGNGTGTVWLDLSDGSIVKQSLKMTMMNVPVTVTVTRK